MCLVILGTTPRVLTRDIDVLLDATASIVRLLRLDMNIEKGKTEALVLFRGKMSTALRERWRQQNGDLAIPLRKFGHGENLLRIVMNYKHFGMMIDA